jgi:methionyl-tRNA formyltransferase
LCVLAWWPEIVRAPALNVPRRGWVNMHPSLLPWGKGKHGYYWSLVHGEPFGVSLHLIDAGIDSGSVLFQRELPTDWTDTGETLYRRSLEAIIDLFRASWPAISAGDLHPVAQAPEAGSYHWGKEIEAHSQIDLDAPYRGRELLNILRARTFWSGDSAWFLDDGHRYRVKLAIERVD